MIDIAIVGAGPCALSCINLLAQRHPSWFKGEESSPVIRVIDPLGWMGKWNTLFKSLEIPRLRSPATFHVDSAIGDGLLYYAVENSREDELEDLPGMHLRLGNGKSGCRHNRHFTAQDLQRLRIPSTKLFESHYKWTIEK
jgi:hypothetical protein